ncbi:MAG: carboxypeptidase-like regulatory domain-containing protein [Odoribacter splanchnicus]
MTDVSGKFELTLPASIRYVVVSFIGYEALKADISGKTEFTFRLKEEVSQLDEVVVTGYQQMKSGKLLRLLLLYRQTILKVSEWPVSIRCWKDRWPV